MQHDENLPDGWKRVYTYDDDEEKLKSTVRQHIKPFKFEPTYAKVIKAGPIIATYKYQKPAFLKAKNSPKWTFRTGRKKLGEEQSLRHDEHRRHGTIRARNKLRFLALSNFTVQASKFITLTFSDNKTVFNRDTGQEWTFKHHEDYIKLPKQDLVPFNNKNVEHTNKVFKKFIQRMRYVYGNFKYIVVIEFQDKNDRGAVHYHMIADLPFLRLKEFSQDMWGWGYVLATNIKHVDDVGRYVTKYMTADINDIRLSGKKAYQTSKNLDKPEEYVSHDAYEVMSDIHWTRQVPVDEKEYGDEESFVGKIEFKEYHADVITNLQVEKRKKRISDNRKIKAHLNKSPNELPAPTGFNSHDCD
jgi:hypothetical protein